MHDAVSEQFVHSPRMALTNRAFLAKGKLAFPVLAVVEPPYGAAMASE